MSRNLGAGKKDRVLKSYFICLTYAFAIGALLGGLFLLFGQQFLSLFATEPAVIEAGKERLYIMSFPMRFPRLWMAPSRLPAESERVFRQP